jgi:hypothetical protein
VVAATGPGQEHESCWGRAE